MNEQQDKLWSAYVDGELSATEAARFDQSLTAEQRDHLAAEMRFESAMVEVLGRDASCPDAVWRRTLMQVQSGAGRRSGSTVQRWAYRLAAVAAVAILGGGLLFLRSYTASPSWPTTMESSVAELKQESQAGPGATEIQQFLNDRGVRIVLASAEDMRSAAAPHEVHLLGAREARFQKEPVYEVLFECCGQPVKMLVTQKGGQASEELGRAANRGGIVQATRDLGAYRVAVVGKHHSESLLDAVSATS